MPTITQIPDLGPAGDLSASIAGIVTLVILALGALAWRRLGALFAEMSTDVKTTKADVKATKADVKITKVQTTNSHETNLRDDLTEVINKIDSLTTSFKTVEETMGKLDDRQATMHEDIRDTRRDVRFATEYVRDVDKRFIRHMDDERREGGGGTNG